VLRSSSSGGSTGVSVATTAPAATVSPSRSAMRARRPASGALTMWRSGRRVLASSSIVLSKGPTAAVAISTSTGRGAKAQARAATTASAAAPVITSVRLFIVHSLVFSAATMSSRSMRLRTTSALAAAAASTARPAQA
jgi:hypothetical protein